MPVDGQIQKTAVADEQPCRHRSEDRLEFEMRFLSATGYSEGTGCRFIRCGVRPRFSKNQGLFIFQFRSHNAVRN